MSRFLNEPDRAVYRSMSRPVKRAHRASYVHGTDSNDATNRSLATSIVGVHINYQYVPIRALSPSTMYGIPTASKCLVPIP